MSILGFLSVLTFFLFSVFVPFTGSERFFYCRREAMRFWSILGSCELSVGILLPRCTIPWLCSKVGLISESDAEVTEACLTEKILDISGLAAYGLEESTRLCSLFCCDFFFLSQTNVSSVWLFLSSIVSKESYRISMLF